MRTATFDPDSYYDFLLDQHLQALEAQDARYEKLHTYEDSIRTDPELLVTALSRMLPERTFQQAITGYAEQLLEAEEFRTEPDFDLILT
jgi:hypothetical protein